MNKQILTLAMAVALCGLTIQSSAQSNKEKKSRYYQNNSPEPEFNVQGFFIENEKNEVEKTPVEKEYNVKIDRAETDRKYRQEKRIREKQEEDAAMERETYRQRAEAPKQKGHYTSYGAFVPDRNYRTDYDNNQPVYREGNRNPYAYRAPSEPTPAPAPAPRREEARRPVKEKEIKMTSKENEYVTTVVKRRYTNLDVLADDLDLAKIQRPVFKGICTETAKDVDAIIMNKNMTSLEKNYHLKQCYILRDKRLRETLDEDQYRKFLRIKDADEYLILTADPELKDGVNR